MKEAESARFNRTHSAASQLSTRTCSFPRSILPTFSHPGQAPGQSHLRARAIRYKPPFPRAHNKGCDVFARVNDAQTSYRVTFNEDTHRKNRCVLFSSRFRAQRFVQHVALRDLFFPARECPPRGTNKFKLLSEEFPSPTTS